ALDAAVAPEIHQSLPLSRRVASDPGVWRFLTVVHRPDYVPHRWAMRSKAQMVRRYWDFGTRPDSNAFARLWWIAELTITKDASGDPYHLTRRVLGAQPLATAIFTRTLSQYAPAVSAL